MPTEDPADLADVVRSWLLGAADSIVGAADELTALDARIGDGDHGINLARGMLRVRELVTSSADASATDLLRGSGRALISSVGGASGPLYGTFFLEVSEGLAPSDDPIAALAPAVERGAAGIARRGRSAVGMKTMLDTLVPAAEALNRSAAGQARPAGGGAILAAAREGCDSTRPMVAQRGRASYLGERAIGHLDPGARSALLVVEALVAALGGQPADASERFSR